MNLFVCVCEIRLNHQIFPAVFGVTLSPIKTTYLGGKVTLHPHPANTFWNPRFLSDNNSDLSCFQTNYSLIPFTVWCWSGDQGPHPNCCCRRLHTWLALWNCFFSPATDILDERLQPRTKYSGKATQHTADGGWAQERSSRHHSSALISQTPLRLQHDPELSEALTAGGRPNRKLLQNKGLRGFKKINNN